MQTVESFITLRYTFIVAIGAIDWFLWRCDITLRIVSVTSRMSQYCEVQRLMKTAFPQNEQLPIWLLNLLAKRKMVEFHAFFDEDDFCGILYTAENNNLVFILYLAVNDKIRSKGYGSQILQYVKRHSKGKTIVLNVEALNSSAANSEQRKKRIEFYRKNGILDTGYTFIDKGEIYSVLASDCTRFHVQEYKCLLKKFSLGLYRKNITAR